MRGIFTTPAVFRIHTLYYMFGLWSSIMKIISFFYSLFTIPCQYSNSGPQPRSEGNNMLFFCLILDTILKGLLEEQQVITQRMIGSFIYHSEHSKWGCLKRRHVYKASKPWGRLAKIYFGRNVYDGGLQPKLIFLKDE